jgi:hypothetical protein
MRYTNESNLSKPYVDWREPAFRVEGFLRWLKWRMRWGDLDHYVCNNAYRRATGDMSPTHAPMTKEQQYWFSLIFGMTYQSEMAWVIYWHFPNFFEIDFEELKQWNDDTFGIQKYAKDTKYNKGRIVEQVMSLRSKIEPFGTIENFFNHDLTGDAGKDFLLTFDKCLTFHKYGRMTSWITCQTLFETADLFIKPDSVLATDPSCWSVRKGLLYLYNKVDDAYDDNTKLTEEETVWIKEKELELYQTSLEYIDDRDKEIFSNFLLESHLCQYKKLMLGGDYAGHSSGDHVSRALWLQERWNRVNFDAFFLDAIKRHSPLVAGIQESKPLRDLCKMTGQLINMHEDFDDMPNMYKELGINPEWLKTSDHDKIILGKIRDYGQPKGILDEFFAEQQ